MSSSSLPELKETLAYRSVPPVAVEGTLHTLDSRSDERPSHQKITAQKRQHVQRLTPREKRFVENYLSGMSRAESVIPAGYKHWSKADAEMCCHNLLRRESLKKEIARRFHQLYDGLELRTEDIIDQYRLFASLNLADFLVVDPMNPNCAYVDLRGKTREQLALVKNITYDAEGRLRVEFVDKEQALAQLARFMKLELASSPNPNTGEGTIEFMTRLSGRQTQ